MSVGSGSGVWRSRHRGRSGATRPAATGRWWALPRRVGSGYASSRRPTVRGGFAARVWAATTFSVYTAGQPTRNDRGGKDTQRQPAQRHIEGAGDLLGEIVSVDRVGPPAAVGGLLEPRSQHDAHHDTRNAECAEQSAQRRGQPRRHRCVGQVDPKPDRKHPGGQVERRQGHGVVARVRVIQCHRDGEVGDPHQHRSQTPYGYEQQGFSGRRPPGTFRVRCGAAVAQQRPWREDRRACGPGQITLVSDAGRRRVLRDAVECVDVAADGKAPHQDPGDQRRGPERDGREPGSLGAAQQPAGRDEDGGQRHRAVHHRRRDDRDVLLAKTGRALQRVAHPPPQVEGSAQRRDDHRGVADDLGRPEPASVCGGFRVWAGDHRLRGQQRAGEPQPCPRPDTTRHVHAAAGSDRLDQVEHDESDHQQRVGDVQQHAEPGHGEGKQGHQRHHPQEREQRCPAVRDADAEIQVPRQEQRYDEQDSSGHVAHDVPPAQRVPDRPRSPRLGLPPDGAGKRVVAALAHDAPQVVNERQRRWCGEATPCRAECVARLRTYSPFGRHGNGWEQAISRR